MMPTITGVVSNVSACGEARRSRARRAEHLADLERVVAVAAIERGDRAVVVDDELVVSAEAIHDQAGIDVLVVVHALDVR